MDREHKVPQGWQGLSPCLCHSWHSATRASQSVPLSSSGQSASRAQPSPGMLDFLFPAWLLCIFLGFLFSFAPPEARSASRAQGWLGFSILSPAASSWLASSGRSGLSSPRNLPGPKCEHTLSPWPKLAVPCQNEAF